MTTLPTYRVPFPSGIVSAEGCFALETDPSIVGSYDVPDQFAPVLYRTKLFTRDVCKDLRTFGVTLDQECHVLRRDQNNQECPPDNYIAHIGQPVCEYYESRGMFLTECDCLKRDNVPDLAVVVALCREKAAHQQELADAYNAQVAAGADPATLTRPVMTVNAEMCDKLEAREELRMYPLTERDLFTHMLSRYLVRASYVENIRSRLTDPSVANDPTSGYHAACTLRACSVPESPMHHVPYSETTTAIGACKVNECTAEISSTGAGGKVTIAGNLFRVNCTGGENCLAVNFTAPCGEHGACQADGSCECDIGWTGEDCSIETNPDDVTSERDVPDDPTLPDDSPPDDNNDNDIPPPATATIVTEEKKELSPALIGLLGVGVIFGVIVLVSILRDAD